MSASVTCRQQVEQTLLYMAVYVYLCLPDCRTLQVQTALLSCLDVVSMEGRYPVTHPGGRAVGGEPSVRINL